MSRSESYAQALIAVGNAEGGADAIESDLHTFANAVSGSSDLQLSLIHI